MTGTRDRYTLPDIPEIGRINGREVAAYTHLLLALLQRSDRFCCGTAPAAYTRALLPKAKAWIKKIEDSVALVPADGLVAALEGFDMLHRIAFGCPASGDFTGRCYMAAFEARAAGGRSVADTDLFRAVAERLHQRDKAFFGRPMLWYVDTLERWHKACCRTGAFSGIPLHTALRQADLLLNEDLFAFEGSRQEILKQNLAAHYAGCVLAGDAYDNDGDTLRAKLAFLRGNRRSVASPSQASEAEQRLLCALAISPDIPAHDRRAFALDAEFNAALAETVS